MRSSGTTTTARPLRRGRRLLAVFLALSFGAAFVAAVPLPAAAAPCDAPVVNEIACENTKTGNPSSEWEITGSGSASIQGFATDISVNRGSTIGFKIKTTLDQLPPRHLPDGLLRRRAVPARSPRSTSHGFRPSRPACTESSTGLIDCGNWTQTASWAVPSTAVSGIYFAKLVSGSGRRATSSSSSATTPAPPTCSSRPPTRPGRPTTTTAATASTWAARPGRAYKVSYNRPFDTNAETPEDFVWNAEYPMVRFLEANGYDVSYTTGVDTDRRGNLIKNHKTFLSVGHDEYWSGGQRANVEAARDAGVNLAFFSGNEVFWKTRWENSISTRQRQLPHPGHATRRPTPTPRSTRPPPGPAPGAIRGSARRPTAAGRRTASPARSSRSTAAPPTWRSDGADGQLRFWRNTRVANLTADQTTTLGSRHPRLRMGREPGQRLPASRPDPPVHDDREACRATSRTTAAPTRRARRPTT